MSAAVVDLLPPPAPSQHLVEMLERMLSQAKAGEIVFACVVAQARGGEVIDGWSSTVGVRPYSVLGALEAVKYEFARRNID
ncbi:hypothetical protein [Variovorax sp. DAIF25]|uniref:hypothetical protein n=1 Tax=Variovorax sp. DAIF25 TaxID=3080983 RepID=UPI003D6AC3F9